MRPAIRLLPSRASRPRRATSRLLVRHASSNNYDSAGRTPGFARRRQSQHPQQQPSSAQSSSTQPSGQPLSNNEQLSKALSEVNEDSNNLLAPVSIPEDRHGILQPDHPSTSILANSSIVVQRQLEMMNVFLGFEQANRYVVMDPQGNHIGYLAEQDHGLGSTMVRQLARTHRSFTTHVFDQGGKEVLRFHRPFSWISSRIRVYDATTPPTTSTSTSITEAQPAAPASPDTPSTSSLSLAEMRIIGEAQQQWAPLRRKYNLFLHREVSIDDTSASPQLDPPNPPIPNSSTALQLSSQTSAESPGMMQFASVDEPFLSWDFSLRSEHGELLASVNRNFVGFAREIFTDTGVYALRMDAAGLAEEPRHLISRSGDSGHAVPDTTSLTLDQRAVMLATAVSIDFDYFSRKSGGVGGGGFMPLWWPMGGEGGGAAAGEAGAAGAGAGAAGAAGAAEGAGAIGAAGAGSVARGAGGAMGAGEGAMAGAGSLAGYDALQRARETQQQEPTMGDAPASTQDSPQSDFLEDPWDDGGPPGGQGGGGAGDGSQGGAEGGEEGGGGLGDILSDFFGGGE